MKKVMIVIIIVMTLLLFRCYQKNNILEHRERIFAKWNMTSLMSYRILSLSDPYYKRLSKLKMYGNCNNFITGLRLLEINDDINYIFNFFLIECDCHRTKYRGKK